MMPRARGGRRRSSPPPRRSRRLLRALLLVVLPRAQIRRRREVASRHGVVSDTYYATRIQNYHVLVTEVLEVSKT
uniref:Uncharacterized protein n=2 Tax=Setaria italica TaxID=4555 RepID=K3YXC7_SETIT